MSLCDDQNTALNPELLDKIGSEIEKIELFYQNQRYWLFEKDLPFIIGREDKSCHLCVDSINASRIHCVICIKDGRIGLLDQSTNGTVIQSGRSDTVLIKNEFIPLSGQGYIKPGETISLEDEDLIRYKIA